MDRGQVVARHVEFVAQKLGDRVALILGVDFLSSVLI